MDANKIREGFLAFIKTGKLQESEQEPQMVAGEVVPVGGAEPTAKQPEIHNVFESDDNDEDDVGKVYEGVDSELTNRLNGGIESIRQIKDSLKAILSNEDYVEYMKSIDALETLSGKL